MKATLIDVWSSVLSVFLPIMLYSTRLDTRIQVIVHYTPKHSILGQEEADQNMLNFGEKFKKRGSVTKIK